MPHFSNKNFQITYDDIRHLVQVVMIGFIKSASYREGWEKAQNIAIAHRCNRWLVDRRLFKGCDPEDYRWLLEEWHPESAMLLERIGNGEKRRVAALVPPTVFAETPVKQSVKGIRQTEQDEYVGYFATEAEAYTFLTQRGAVA